MFSLVLNPMIKLSWFRENRALDVDEARTTLLNAVCLILFLVRFIHIEIF
jgi:hypothetical protein